MQPLKMLSAIAALAALVHAGDYSTWTSYRPVTLSTSGMGLSGAVTNIPISVRFKASAHKDMLDSLATQVQPDGSDIRVTLADGTTDVLFEIEHIDTGANGRLHLWILAANVPANSASAASFRVYWGKTGETSMSNPAATFDTSAGYRAVFHMNDTGSTIVNAADTSLNGTATGTAIVTGQNAGSGFVSAKSGARVRGFENSNGGASNDTPVENYIQFSPEAGHILRTHTGPITLEAWVYSSITQSANSSQGTKHIVAQGAGNMGGKAWLARTADLDGSSAQNHYSAGGPNNIQGPIAPWGEQNNWHYVVGSWDGTNWTLYRQREGNSWNNPQVDGPDGMLPDSAFYKVIPGNAPTASAHPWFIGAASDDSVGGGMTRGWHGWMDEVRISTVARDSNYVKLTFLTTRNDSLTGVLHPVSIGGTESAAPSPYADWTGHRSIVLNTSATGANVTGDVANFPVLIRLGNADAAIIAAANGGNSIRFSKADNTTALPYEIESWSPTAAAIWVKVDNILGNNATQTIRMHWGNPAAASESNGAAVFDTANGHVAVWHMNGTTTDTSSTAHEFVATPFGDPGVINQSAIGRGRTFDGTQHMQVLNSASSAMNFASTDTYTFSAWVRSDSIVPTGTNTGHLVVSKGDHQWALAIFGGTTAGTPPNRYYEITTKVGNQNGWRQTTTAPTTNPVYAGDTANSHIGVWRHMTGTWDGTSNTASIGKIYMDGVLQKTMSFNVGTNPNAARQTARDVHIGVLSNEGTNSTNATGTLQRFFVGALDEITVSKGVRDSHWVRLSYQNQREINTLVNIGNPVFLAPGAPTGVTAVADTGAAIVSWTAPVDNGGKPILSYFATVVGDTLTSCTSTTLSCTMNLPLGTSVNIVVRAINEVGRGPNSSASNPVTPISPVVPTSPQGVTAVTAGSASIAVGWSVPAYNGGSPITGYTVTGTPGGSCGPTTELLCVVSGLTQGTAYKFTVVAINAIGPSAPSDTATATTTGILPGAFVIAMDGSRTPYTYRLPVASVAATDKLSMIISDVQGKRIWARTINPAATKVGELTWNGTTSTGHAVAPGLYVVRIKAEVNGKVIEAIQKGIKQ